MGGRSITTSCKLKCIGGKIYILFQLDVKAVDKTFKSNALESVEAINKIKQSPHT